MYLYKVINVKKKKCGNRKLGNLGSFSSLLFNLCIILVGVFLFIFDI